MTLQTSGQIKMSEINVELDMSSSQANSSLQDASEGISPYPSINTDSPSYPDGTIPYEFSDFYSYNHDYSADHITFSSVDCNPTDDLVVYGTQSGYGSEYLYVFVQEYDGPSTNGTKSTCITNPSASWNTGTDFSTPNSGTDSLDITLTIYDSAACTGSVLDSDSANGEICAS